MSNHPSPVWKIPPDSALNWTQCGDEHIVYHPASGETHYLNDLSALVLRMLEAEPATTVCLSQRITDFLGVANNDKLEQQIDSLLARFDQLGVVERTVSEVDSGCE